MHSSIYPARQFHHRRSTVPVHHSEGFVQSRSIAFDLKECGILATYAVNTARVWLTKLCRDQTNQVVRRYPSGSTRIPSALSDSINWPLPSPTVSSAASKQ